MAGELHEISAAIGRLTGLVESLKEDGDARETRIRGDFKEHRERIHAEVNRMSAHVAKVEETIVGRLDAVENWQTTASTERKVNRWWMAKLLGIASIGGAGALKLAEKLLQTPAPPAPHP
jgi:hypothetical protein